MSSERSVKSGTLPAALKRNIKERNKERKKQRLASRLDVHIPAGLIVHVSEGTNGCVQMSHTARKEWCTRTPWCVCTCEEVPELGSYMQEPLFCTA